MKNSILTRTQISDTAIVYDSATIGEGSIIRAGAEVGRNAKLGKNVVIPENTIVEGGIYVPDNTIVPNTVGENTDSEFPTLVKVSGTDLVALENHVKGWFILFYDNEWITMPFLQEVVKYAHQQYPNSKEDCRNLIDSICLTLAKMKVGFNGYQGSVEKSKDPTMKLLSLEKNPSINVVKTALNALWNSYSIQLATTVLPKKNKSFVEVKGNTLEAAGRLLFEKLMDEPSMDNYLLKKAFSSTVDYHKLAKLGMAAEIIKMENSIFLYDKSKSIKSI